MANSARSIISRLLSKSRDDDSDLGPAVRVLDANHGFARDLDGRVTSWTEGAARLYGWDRSVVADMDCHALLRSAFAQPREDIEATLRRDGVWRGEIVQRRRDGASIRVSSHWALLARGDLPPLVLESNFDISRYAQAEQSQRYLAAIVESSDDPIIGKSLDGQVTSWNRAAEIVLGWTAEEMIGGPITPAIPPDLLDEEAELRARISAGFRIQHQMTRRLRRDGGVVPVSLTMSPIRDDGGAVIGVSTILRDVTAQREAESALQDANEQLERRVAERTRELADQMEARQQAEAALAQAQKLEAVGQLTGGVAHDFNNLLTVITGNLHFIGKFAEREPRLQRLTESTLRAVERGARLTGRLLAFARRQTLQPERLLIDQAVREFSALVLRAVGESVQVEIVAEPGMWPAEIDPAQFEAALLNLAINARDAMPNGGRLRIATANAQNPAEGHLRPGRYVRVEVSDTGEGMTSDVAARAIEPFFTTKEVGKGSGLGLSQAYGFAQQSGGALVIDTRPKQGTRVRMYFPALAAPAPDAPEEPRPAPAAPFRRVSVLVVEDDADVLELVRDTLSEEGHDVLTAPDGRAALALLMRNTEVQLLVSDVVMPNGVSGVALAHAARKLRPGTAVLLISGYPRDALNKGGGTEGFAFLSKPFRPAELAAQVRGLLATA